MSDQNPPFLLVRSEVVRAVAGGNAQEIDIPSKITEPVTPGMKFRLRPLDGGIRSRNPDLHVQITQVLAERRAMVGLPPSAP